MNKSDRKSVGQVLLFSGHRIDEASRDVARFPPEAEAAVARELDRQLSFLKVRANDLGITQGACGGDLLFAEAMLARGASLQLHLPFYEARFRKNSVAYAKRTPPSDRWLKRFLAVRNHPRVAIQIMANATGFLPRHPDPYERCNRWMLREAFSLGGHRAHSIFLWDGEKGDGKGGTAHMMRCVQLAGGKYTWMDMRKLLAR